MTDFNTQWLTIYKPMLDRQQDALGESGNIPASKISVAILVLMGLAVAYVGALIFNLI